MGHRLICDCLMNKPEQNEGLDFILPDLNVLFHQTVVSFLCVCEGMNQCKTFLILSFKSFQNTEINEMISNWNTCQEKAKRLREEITKNVKCREAEPELASPMKQHPSCTWPGSESQREEETSKPSRQRKQQVQRFCPGPQYLECGNHMAKKMDSSFPSFEGRKIPELLVHSSTKTREA